VYHRRAHERLHCKEVEGKLVLKVIRVRAHDALAPSRKGVRRTHKSLRSIGRLEELARAFQAGHDGIP
jgi:hypothetical protein